MLARWAVCHCDSPCCILLLAAAAAAALLLPLLPHCCFHGLPPRQQPATSPDLHMHARCTLSPPMQTIQESMRLLLMVRAFQVMGHYAGAPLGLAGCACMLQAVHTGLLCGAGRLVCAGAVNSAGGVQCQTLDRHPLHTVALRTPAGAAAKCCCHTCEAKQFAHYACRSRSACHGFLLFLHKPAAQLDPLGLDERPRIKELDPAYYGFSEKDLDRE